MTGRVNTMFRIILLLGLISLAVQAVASDWGQTVAVGSKTIMFCPAHQKGAFKIDGFSALLMKDLDGAYFGYLRGHNRLRNPRNWYWLSTFPSMVGAQGEELHLQKVKNYPLMVNRAFKIRTDDGSEYIIYPNGNSSRVQTTSSRIDRNGQVVSEHVIHQPSIAYNQTVKPNTGTQVHNKFKRPGSAFWSCPKCHIRLKEGATYCWRCDPPKKGVVRHKKLTHEEIMNSPVDKLSDDEVITRAYHDYQDVSVKKHYWTSKGFSWRYWHLLEIGMNSMNSHKIKGNLSSAGNVARDTVRWINKLKIAWQDYSTSNLKRREKSSTRVAQSPKSSKRQNTDLSPQVIFNKALMDTVDSFKGTKFSSKRDCTIGLHPLDFPNRVYQSLGCDIPTDINALITAGEKIESLDDLRPGDILIFGMKTKDKPDFAGVCYGQNKIALIWPKKGFKICSLLKFLKASFVCARRFFPYYIKKYMRRRHPRR